MTIEEVAKHLKENGSHQTPEEVYPMLKEMEKINPKTIVEIGVELCGLNSLFCVYFPKVTVVAVDVVSVDDPTRPGVKERVEKYGIKYICGDSQKPETQNEVFKALGQKKYDFLFIDGAHSRDDVWKDWNLWSPYTKMVGFHDIYAIDCGTYKFWSEFVPTQKTVAVWKKFDGNGIGLIIK